jgi:NAD(P)-dependent dehydrogenase (short-subunit alcohol dehydrogenase family)
MANPTNELTIRRQVKNKNTSANKVAIVTGSATGIGYETAVHLAKNGIHTYATMRNLQKANGITEMAKTENLPLSLIQLDVTDDISITKAIDTVINESRRIDVLVNNAGYGLVGSVEDMSIEEMKAQYETNVFGTYRVTKAVIPHMRKQRGGSIINISSIAGRIALPLYSAYVSTKFAIEGLSESMAYELEPFGIKVAIIEPGAIKTNFRREQAAKGSSEVSPYSSMMQSPSKAIEKMLKHRLYPEEVAKTVIQAIENPKPKLRYIVGKDAEELIELRRKSSDEEFFHMVGQNILKKEEQEFPFPQNRDQVAAQEQFRTNKVVVDGERTAI